MTPLGHQRLLDFVGFEDFAPVFSQDRPFETFARLRQIWVPMMAVPCPVTAVMAILTVFAPVRGLLPCPTIVPVTVRSPVLIRRPFFMVTTLSRQVTVRPTSIFLENSAVEPPSYWSSANP